jgi:predicted porin
MKKTLIALATLAAAGTAFAQSSVTISGSISAGIMDTGAPNARPVVSHLGNGANAININTVEDLGGGMRAGFTSQIRFNGATGDTNSTNSGQTSTTNGALFHAANAYVSGGFGTIRVGKIAEASTCGLDPWACGGGAALQGGVGIGSGTTTRATVSGITGAGSQANSVSFATPTINGFSASYQTTMSDRANERSVLSVNYAKGPLTLLAMSIEGSGSNVALESVASNTAAGVTAGTDKGKHTAVGGSYNFGVATVSLVNSVSKNNTVATGLNKDVMSLGLTVPMGAYTILAGYNKDSKAAATADTLTSVGVNYALSKRTIIGADLFKNEAIGSTGYVARVRHAF